MVGLPAQHARYHLHDQGLWDVHADHLGRGIPHPMNSPRGGDDVAPQNCIADDTRAMMSRQMSRTPQVINIHGDTDEPLQCSERALPDRRKRGRPPGHGTVAWRAQPPALAALTEPAMCRRSSFGCVDDVLQDIHSLAQSQIFLAPARADRPAGRYRPARAAADVCAPFAQGRRRRRGRR